MRPGGRTPGRSHFSPIRAQARGSRAKGQAEAGLILETTFLIDLERELARGHPGPAHGFFTQHPAEPRYITFTIAGELAASVPVDQRTRWESLVQPLQVLPSTPAVWWEYGQAFRFLEANGLQISANELWIAATALAFRKRW